MQLSDRMKEYEGATQYRFMPLIPTCARIDGKCFHTYTRGMDRPYDMTLIDCMRETTRALVVETNAAVGYTQSDEITLIWHSDSYGSEIFFSGKLQKMCSVLASVATVNFNSLAQLYKLRNQGRVALFDCRVWQVPNLVEAANVMVWREQDAVRNSVNMLGQAHFSHKELHEKSTGDILQMLSAKGVDWHALPTRCKRGSYYAKCHIERKFTADELEKLPEKHEARSNPDLIVRRSDVLELETFSARNGRVAADFLFNEKSSSRKEDLTNKGD